MSYYDRALELKDELIENRRYLHSHAEAGLTLQNTVAYVEKKLREYGIEPERCGEGVTALIGKGGKVLLLRADMDALEMPEESGLAFASMNPQTAHCCGHDMHAAMLLTAAKMLKEHESELQGTVKLMFQPGEECLIGSQNMLENGILENPKVDAALAYHVGPGKLPIGMFMYNDNSTMMYSNNEFSVTVKGKGGHGALPQNCIDPISVGAHIIIALQEIIARELDLPGAMEYPNISASASEDFAFVAERVPSAFMYLSSGYMDERGNYSAHNPKVQFNEEVLPRGAAYLAQCAQRWLEEHH